jgi:hypothetical protein
MKWKLLCTLFGVVLGQAALATIPLYQNKDFLEYTIPGTPPPQIDAKAFDNENIFTINYATFNPGTPYYETMNTLFYTNSGTMIANSPNNLFSVTLLTLGLQNFGCGYNFDLQNSGRQWADTFYNPGTIRSASTIDGNGLTFNGVIIFGTQFAGLTQYTSYGKVSVSATNIINPGVVDVSVSGQIDFSGRNVDLTGGRLTVEPPLNFFGSLGTVGINSIGATGIDTNGDWNAGLDLSPPYAYSSFVPIPPFYLDLTNCQSYLDVKSPNTNYNIYRYVFVQNNSPNVPYHVYIDAPNTLSLGFQAGAAHVEWVATYTDPASGAAVNNYLYLTDDYALGAATNNFVLGGVPLNFSFISWPAQLLFGPTPPGFTNLPNIYQSNNYACFFGNLTAATASTNVSYLNPHGTITNLQGKIYLTASNELNLTSATIAGANYLSLICTNQFDGSAGASISAPFADISLGVTNGFMTVSNLLLADIPNWSGPIQAWSSDWFTVDTTVTPNVTNEYKVMIVFSQLQPTTAPWIQNLYLHGTNTLTISDHLNVYGSLFSDARSVTLNTNLVGVGSTSLDGELTWLNPAPFNANTGSGLQQMPNLLWLTNSGAIHVLNTANFGSATTPQFGVTPAMPAVPASGVLAETGTNAVKNDKVIIGTNQYAFVATITNTVPNQVKIATNFDGSMNNLIAAINRGTGAGTAYSTNTKANPKASAGALASHAFSVAALNTNAAVGNLVPTLFTPATAAVNLTWSNPTLTNATDYVPPVTNYTAFINHGLVADKGTAIWTTYFENDGTVSNGTGSFVLQCGSAVLTNGNLMAGGDVVLIATNTPGSGVNSLIISNHMIQAGRKLTLWSSNITDTGVTNGNIWVVGSNGISGSFNLSVNDSGFNIPLKPLVGDLLGTTVTNIAPASVAIYNFWSATNYGLSTRGYTNNLALGQLILDAKGSSLGGCMFYFNGVGTNNALYVDDLQLLDFATQGNATNSYNFPWLKINTNMVIYYAQALKNGLSVAEAIDNQSRQGANGGRLRWVYSYAGYFSSTNVVYPDGTTNTFNTALAQSTTIDSDGDGIVNALDPTPFFVPSEINLTVTTTNLPPLSARLEWTTIPNATNFIYYTTNLLGNNWLAFTNFKNWYYGNNVAVTNAAHGNSFRSPQTYIVSLSPPDNSQTTNVWVFDVITNVPHYYKVAVWPWLNYPH